MSLYHKYRPQSFEEMKGNSGTVEALKALVGKPDSPHAFLIFGPTGCGKTTLGRIVLKELGCRGRDLREIDSADFRGIDTIRAIRHHVQYKGFEGASRGYLMDEAHKITNDAQNALLKALEDPPSHVYFVLCTTDPKRLLPTVRGRCSQHQVEPLTERQMIRLLRRVCKAEGKKVEMEVLEQVAESSAGHPRNALMILEDVLLASKDRMLAVSRKKIEEDLESIELCRALFKHRPWKGVARILKSLEQQDPEGVRRAVLGYCSSALLGGPNDRAALIMEEFIEPFYDSGFPQLVLACYSVHHSGSV